MKRDEAAPAEKAPVHSRIAGISVWIAVAVCLLIAAPARAVQRQLLTGHVPTVVPGLHPIGDLPGTQSLNLAIGLPLRNGAALTNLIQQLYDPASPGYRRFLTPDQFAAAFAPTESDYQGLIAFAKSKGLTVTGTHSNRLLLDVSGPVAELERILHVHLRVYQHPTESRTFYAPDSEPALDLDVPVLSIIGLDNFVVPHSANLSPVPLQQGARANVNGSGPFGYYGGYDFRHAYAPGVPQDGSGEKVALLEFDGYFPGDVASYLNLTGLPTVSIVDILLDGFNGAPGQGNIEVSLDIDMAISMAPNLAEVLVYEGLFPDDVLNRIATDNLARQISSSWTYSVDATTTQIFQQYAAQGQSFFNASGDSGAYPGAPAPPTDNPYLTSVGGTDLTTATPGGPWASETTWPRGSGGFSTTYAIPSWQQGIDMTTDHGSTTMRNLPDVAMVATGVFLVANNGQEYSVAGTSISAPLWAGFTALVNQLALTNGEPAVGFINPAIYAFSKGANYGSGFHDITTGNNENAGSPTNFPAVPGYDLCTGWGTPTGSNLMYAIGVPEPLRISPLAAAIVSGPVGGPFMPASQVYSLTNNGAGSLNWALGKAGLWFSASPTSGTLVSGGPAASVSIAPNSFASNAVPGYYTASFWFTNLTDGFVETRQVALAVVTMPVITAQPASQAVFQGTSTSFSVGTASNALLFFQWRLDNGSYITNLSDGAGVSGSTTSFLSVSNVQPSSLGAYSVVVSNAAGVTISSNAFLAIVPWRPVITVQPTNLTVLPGAPAAFSVAAVGSQPFSYQWQFDGVPLTNDENYSGSTSNTLTLLTATVTNVGAYSVIVSNSLGTDTSSAASLSLTSVTAPGITLTPLHSFTNRSDGAFPYAPLVQAPDGNFYGTTYEGGPNFFGTVFRMTTNGTVTTQHAFNGSSGAFLYPGLVLATNGLLYGATTEGGSTGDGVAFHIGTNGVFGQIHTFDETYGAFPVAGFAQGTDGNFYGTTLEGGQSGLGTVFKMSATGAVTPLVSFNGLDGAFPSPVLLQATDGDFYGTAENGGASGDGTVFKITASGALTTLHSFGYTDGAVPVPGLVQDTDGSFYGTAESGGTNGFGTVFRLAPDGTFSTLYSFTGGADGAYPFGGLLIGADGNIYGTASSGGAYTQGTVFRLGPNGSLATLVQFDGYQGANPAAALTQTADGSLYGTTQGGGLAGDGTVYRLTLSGALQITSQPATQLAFTGDDVAFSIATFGALPVTYQWRRNGHALTNGANISGCNSRTLVLTNISTTDAALYSVIVSNAFGALTSTGAALEIIVSPPVITTQPVPQTVLAGSTVTFSVEASGDEPLSYQWQENGANLSDGGRISGSGASVLTITATTATDAGVYSVIVSNLLDEADSAGALLTVVPLTAPGASLASLHAFAGGNEGVLPYAGLVQAPSGNLYGTTIFGGAGGVGTVFAVAADGTFTNVYSFSSGSDGGNPYGTLTVGADGNLYGTASGGGTNGFGTVFSMTPAGSVTGRYSFTGGSDGANPVAGLVTGADARLYGTTYGGGTNGIGAAFSIATNGALTTLRSFNSALGGFPYAPLVQDASGRFYGTSSSGGPNVYGAVFSLATNGALATLHAFDYSDGSAPYSALVPGADGSLYGTTSSGGADGDGTVFRLATDGTLTTLYSFAFTDGASPYAGLAQGTDGSFYGTTALGGIGGQGTAFRVTTNGTITTLVWFYGANGANPQAPLMQAADGSFYGTTSYGGANYNGAPATGNGTVFKLTLPMFKANPFAQAPAIATAAYAGTLATNAVAPAGDPLAFGRLSGPAWLNVASDGTLSGTPGYADIGANSFVVSLADTNGWSSSATVQINVLNSAWITAAISRQGARLLLSWNGGNGPYTVQMTADPALTAWAAITGPLNTNALALPVTNATAFYRILGH